MARCLPARLFVLAAIVCATGVVNTFAKSMDKYYMAERCGKTLSLSSNGQSSGAIIQGWKKNAKYVFLDMCKLRIVAPRGYNISVVIDFVELDDSRKLNFLELQPKGGTFRKFTVIRTSSHESTEVSPSPQNELTLVLSVKTDFTDVRKGGFSLIATATQKATRSGDCPHRDQFKCSNGWCVSKDLKCNGHHNCGDKSDEGVKACLGLTVGGIIGISIAAIVIASIAGFFLFRFCRSRSTTSVTYIYR